MVLCFFQLAFELSGSKRIRRPDTVLAASKNELRHRGPVFSVAAHQQRIRAFRRRKCVAWSLKRVLHMALDLFRRPELLRVFRPKRLVIGIDLSRLGPDELEKGVRHIDLCVPYLCGLF